MKKSNTEQERVERLDSIARRLYRIEARLGLVLALQSIAISKENEIMATLQDIQNSVMEGTTVIDSVVALLEALAAKVAALPTNQAAIDQLAADIVAQKDRLAAAVVANTPTEPSSA